MIKNFKFLNTIDLITHIIALSSIIFLPIKDIYINCALYLTYSVSLLIKLTFFNGFKPKYDITTTFTYLSMMSYIVLIICTINQKATIPLLVMSLLMNLLIFTIIFLPMIRFWKNLFSNIIFKYKFGADIIWSYVEISTISKKFKVSRFDKNRIYLKDNFVITKMNRDYLVHKNKIFLNKYQNIDSIKNITIDKNKLGLLEDVVKFETHFNYLVFDRTIKILNNDISYYHINFNKGFLKIVNNLSKIEKESFLSLLKSLKNTYCYIIDNGDIVFLDFELPSGFANLKHHYGLIHEK